MDQRLNWIKKSSGVMYLLTWLVELVLVYGFFTASVSLFLALARTPEWESALVVTLGLEGIGWSPGSMSPALVALAVAILVDGAVRLLLFGSALLIFRNLSDGGSPFSPTNTAHLHRIALLVALTACTDGLPGLLSGWSGLEGIAAPLLMGAALYGLAEIFVYGSLLQQQSDETL